MFYGNFENYQEHGFRGNVFTFVCIFCKQERGRAPICTAPEVSHNKRVTSVGETIRWLGLPLLVVHLASVPSLSAFRFLFGFPSSLLSRDHTANVSARTQARCFIRSGRLICVRNNLTPELRVPARVATSPLAISTSTRLIVTTIVIETTLECVVRHSGYRRLPFSIRWLRIIN